MHEKRIITCAVTGSWGTKEQNPAIPMTPQEIADDVYEVYKAGASVVHLHMRDENLRPKMDAERFKETIALIRQRCDIVINMTSAGDPVATQQGRYEACREVFCHDETRPEIVSYDAGTMNWMHNSIHENSPWLLENLGNLAKEWGVKPECEVFDAGMVYNCLHYMKQGVLQDPLHFQFILGAPGGIDASVENLVFMKSLLPKNATWGAAGLSKAHLPIMFATLALGGQIRVGLEDNIYYDHGVKATCNAQLVERAAKAIELMNLDVATPDEARQILGLTQRK